MSTCKVAFFFLISFLIVCSTRGVCGDEIKVFVAPPSLTVDGSGVESTFEVRVEGTKEIDRIKTFEVFLD